MSDEGSDEVSVDLSSRAPLNRCAVTDPSRCGAAPEYVATLTYGSHDTYGEHGCGARPRFDPDAPESISATDADHADCHRHDCHGILLCRAHAALIRTWDCFTSMSSAQVSP